MGWLGDGSHRAQVRHAWTAVGLLPCYPHNDTLIDTQNVAEVTHTHNSYEYAYGTSKTTQKLPMILRTITSNRINTAAKNGQLHTLRWNHSWSTFAWESRRNSTTDRLLYWWYAGVTERRRTLLVASWPQCLTAVSCIDVPSNHVNGLSHLKYNIKITPIIMLTRRWREQMICGHLMKWNSEFTADQ